jgi:hypothetical protein
MKRIFLATVIFSFVSSAFAQEPVGCDKFKWPLDRERSMLSSAPSVASGGEMPQLSAVKIELVRYSDAKLPVAPTRLPKSEDSYAGFVRAAAPARAGMYRVTLSEAAWVEVIQNGQPIKSGAFSGVTGCEGVRKSVKFDLSTTPFVIEISGTSAQAIAVAITQD